jgi:hypothetical protein
MAGAGYKLFNTGDVLTAAQVNTYLQEQVVMVFANAAARTTALSGVLAEGMVSYLKDTDALEIYSGSAWVGYGSGDITGVTAGTGISGGGTSGTVTITNAMATEITAAGDIIIGTGSGTFDNLPIGTTGQVLTADTTVSPYKVKWASASGGGSLPTARARPSSTQNIAANTNTKVDLGTEDWDTGNCFASSRFTASSAGYYQVNSQISISSGSAGIIYSRIYKNGALWQEYYQSNSNAYNFAQNSTMVYLAVNDYIELYCQHNISGGADLYSTAGFVFLDVTGIRS